MRRHDLDNLRSICIGLLFPYHCFMIYNGWGETFYVNGPPLFLASNFIYFCWPFLMPLLFAIAGISARHALEKRSVQQFARERVSRLLLPFAFGMLVLVPPQAFLKARFHLGFEGNFIEFCAGYFLPSGPFFPPETGHLWFLVYLLIIALAALPLILLYKRREKSILMRKTNAAMLLSLALLPMVLFYVLNIQGKSLGAYFAYYLLGYFVLSREDTQRILDEKRPLFACLFLALSLINLCLLNQPGGASGALYDLFSVLLSWSAILSLLGLGQRFLSTQNRLSAWFAPASFPLYMLHQTILVAIAYWALRLLPNAYVQIPFIIVISFALSMLCYLCIRPIPRLRAVFGIRQTKKR